MKTIDLRDFQLVEPAVLGTGALAFSVMADGTLRINGKLQSAIKTSGLCIRIHSDRKTILLEEVAKENENAHFLARNGRVKTPELEESFSKTALKPPLRYAVEWNEAVGMWVGKYDRHYIFPTHQKNPQKIYAQRKSNLADMLPEVY